VHAIEFDIALSATQENELKGGIGVFFGSVALGGQAKSDKGNSSTNRIKFSIPVKYPDSP
jgi:hypothetical protein